MKSVVLTEAKQIDLIAPFWKPVDWTSFDVVKKVRSHIKPNKVGHAGTLDPFAEGILVLCIGKKTKESQQIMSFEKEYIGTIRFGIETDTLDSTGKVIKEMSIPKLTDSIVKRKLDSFIGNIKQIPPMYSALKKNGQPLYKLARKGITVERQPRIVHVSNLEILDLCNETLTLKINCGKGTYIRSLAKDIANALGTNGHLVTLIRTKIGPYNEKNSLKIDDLQEWLLTIQ